MGDIDKVFGESEFDFLSIENLNDGLILVVDDGSLLIELMLECLKDSGYGILTAGDGAEAARLYKEARPDLLICDIVISKLGGFCFVKELQKEFPNFKAVLMASGPSVEKHLFKDKASELGVVCVIEKPFNVMELLATANLLMADRDIFHAHVRASNSSISPIRRQPSAISPQIIPK